MTRKSRTLEVSQHTEERYSDWQWNSVRHAVFSQDLARDLRREANEGHMQDVVYSSMTLASKVTRVLQRKPISRNFILPHLQYYEPRS